MIRLILRMLVLFIIALSTGCSSVYPTDNSASAEAHNSTSKYKETTIVWYWNNARVQLPNDGYISKKIKEDLNITYIHISPQGSDYNERLNLLLASQDVPDIINSSSALTTRLVRDGIALPVENYLNENNIPNLIHTQKNWDLAVSYLRRDDGHIYAIPSTNNTSVPRISTYIRHDWLRNLGLQVPKDLDELRIVLEMFTKNDPDRNGIDDTFGTSIAEFWGSFGYQWSMAAAYDYWYKTENEKEITLGMFLPRFKDFLKYMKSLYECRAMDRESLTTKRAKVDQYILNSKIGFEFTYGDYEFNNDIKKKQPEAQWGPIPVLKGAYDKGYAIASTVIRDEIVITTKCKDVEAALRLCNYMADDRSTENNLDFTGSYWICRYGEKGVNWDVTTEGKFETGQTNDKIRENNKVDTWASLAARFKSKFDSAYLGSLLPEHRKAIDVVLAYPTNRNIPDNDSKKPVDLEGIAITEEASKLLMQFQPKCEELYSRCILGVADIDKAWAEFVAEAEMAGLKSMQAKMSEIARDYGRLK